jgi:O-antigen/teichoic acid export membrane protein
MVGNYTNADQYSMIPSSTLTNVTSKVSYPILVTLQDDDEKLKAGSGKIAHTVMYISFVVMFGLAAVATPLFLIVFGTKWQASIVFFQVLCVAYAISPMHTINQNIMKVKGRSDLFFRTEIIKYIVFVPFIILGIIFGLKDLITGIAFFYWISFAINAMYSRKLIGYSVFQQIAELIPIFLVSALPALFVWFCSLFLPFGNIGLLAFQGIVYLGIVYALTLIFKIRAYYELKEIITRKLGYVSFINNFKKTL